MPIKTDEYDRVCVMTVTGDLSGPDAESARKIVDDLIEKRQIIDYIVDLEKCEFIDSEGLEALAAVKKKCEDMFGQVKLVHLDDNCKKILEITRLDRRFECHAEVAQALKTMR